MGCQALPLAHSHRRFWGFFLHTFKSGLSWFEDLHPPSSPPSQNIYIKNPGPTVQSVCTRVLCSHTEHAGHGRDTAALPGLGWTLQNPRADRKNSIKTHSPTRVGRVGLDLGPGWAWGGLQRALSDLPALKKTPKILPGRHNWMLALLYSVRIWIEASQNCRETLKAEGKCSVWSFTHRISNFHTQVWQQRPPKSHILNATNSSVTESLPNIQFLPPSKRWINSPSNFQLLGQFVAFRNRVLNNRIWYKNKHFTKNKRTGEKQSTSFSTAPEASSMFRSLSSLSHLAVVPLWPQGRNF